MILSFEIPGTPFSKQSGRSRIVWPKGAAMMNPKQIMQRAFVQHYQDKKVKDAESWVRQCVRMQLPKDFKIHDGPVLVESLVFSFPLVSTLKAADKKAAKAGYFVAKDTKPDIIDNLKKGLFDAMEGIVYTNDSKIVGEGQTVKCYWKRPGTWVKIRLLTDKASLNDLFTFK